MDFYRECLFAHRIHPTVMLDMIKLSKDTSHGYFTIAFDMIHDAITSGKMWLHNQKNVDKHFNTLQRQIAPRKVTTLSPFTFFSSFEFFFYFIFRDPFPLLVHSS
jgi:hypothetical protein